MIVYDRLWETMRNKGVTQYSLIHDYNINEAQLDRFRKNTVIKTSTIDRICEILDCNVEDICQYVRNTSEK
ncbi:XRE family transcriptional regulator [Lachnospiraceae bacterium]|nr:XRE family transcriptional regulator [Lachnospiraceae bacterium]